MSAGFYRISSAVTAAVMLTGLLASLIIGGCDELIPCESGSVPMRCHWSFRATSALFAIGLLAALAQMLPTIANSRAARLFAALTTALLACAIAWLPSSLGIGICSAAGMGMQFCSKDGMDCLTTAPIVWTCAALLVGIAIVQTLKANPNAKKFPRLQDLETSEWDR